MRRSWPLCLGVSFALVASGCTALRPDDGRSTAEAVAAALAAGEVAQIPFANVDAATAQQQLQAVTKNLRGLTPTVEVDSVSDTESEDRREAILSWSWDLPGVEQNWTYDSTLELSPGQEAPWVAHWSPTVVEPSLETGQGLHLVPISPDRGDILGAHGEVLVTERTVHRVGIDKSQLTEADPAEAARDLAEALDIDTAPYITAVEQAGPEAFVEAVPLREEDFRALDPQQMQAIPGLLVVEDEVPLAPSRGFASDILGSVSAATAEDLQASDGQIEAGAMIGRGGLQETHDDRLRGKPGVIVEKVGLQADGGIAPHTEHPLVQIPPSPGETIQVSLDRQLQATAQQLLVDIDSASAIVAIRPSTGDVLAAANGPGSEGYPTALLGQYAPGSTFKVVTALAMLRHGDTPNTTVECTPSITVDGTTFNNVESYPAQFLGEITLKEAMAHSCNTSFIAQHERITQPEIADAAAALGVGMQTDLGVGTFYGSIPESEPPAQHAAALFGQGRTLVSPLTMANLTASIVAGELVTPRLVTTEGLVQTDAAQPSTATPLTSQEAEQLHTTMREVVATGHLDTFQVLSPDTAIGKTGTAEFGSENPPRTHSWVIAAHQDLAVAVFVEDGDLGSITGAPIMLGFLQAAATAGQP